MRSCSKYKETITIAKAGRGIKLMTIIMEKCGIAAIIVKKYTNIMFPLEKSRVLV